MLLNDGQVAAFSKGVVKCLEAHHVAAILSGKSEVSGGEACSYFLFKEDDEKLLCN